MTPKFTVRTTPHFERLFRKLQRQHLDLRALRSTILRTLTNDPYNRSHRHKIKKLSDVPKDEGQYRLKVGRFRFRYDILGNDVVLRYCEIRREDTYK